MPNWIDNAQADYVLAAYAVAVTVFLWLGCAAWCAYRRAQKADAPSSAALSSAK